MARASERWDAETSAVTLLVPSPPTLASLPLGTRLVAGLGHSTVLPELDFETYSEAGFVWNPYKTDKRGRATPKWEPPPGVNPQQRGLPCIGAAVYAEHPSTEVLTASYDLKDGRGVRRWKPGQSLPQDLFDHLARDGLLEAHNRFFEWVIWDRVCTAKYGWPAPPPIEQWRCSAAKARAWNLPGKLAEIGRVLNLHLQKDADGKRLIDKFSIPQNPSKTKPALRIRPEDDPADFAHMEGYCDRDVETEAEASSRIPDLSPDELEFWQIDQLINELGVAVDRKAARGGIQIMGEAFERYNAELRSITGGTVERASELQKLQGWLGARGVHMYLMDEDAIEEKVKELRGGAGFASAEELEALRALEIRQMIGSASVKKLYSLDRRATRSGRVLDMFVYHGARTGRVTGGDPQPTNLPNSGPNVYRCRCGRHFGTSKSACPWCGNVAPPPVSPSDGGPGLIEWCAEAACDAIEVITAGSLDVLEMYFDSALPTISACVRAMFVAGDDCELVSSDYSMIEAVVLAQIAGEQWRTDLFQAGGKIYEASGAKVAGIPYEEVIEYKRRTGNHHECRKKGKTMELALGYGGWVGAMVAFGAGEWMTEDEMKESILAWRKASPEIVKLWGGQFVDEDGMPAPPFFRNVTPRYTGLEGMAVQAVLNPGREFTYRGISYFQRGDVLYCRLLSGRTIAYHRPRLRPSDRGNGYALSYEGWNTNPKNGPMGWIRMDTYGGKLTENVVQAVSRDILRDAIVRLWKAGYKTVMHIYDEIVTEVPRGFGSVEEFERLMSIMPAWAEGWPVRASGGWRGTRYRK